MAITLAGKRDLNNILSWLEQEFERGAEGGVFWRNRETIRQAQVNRDLWILKKDKSPAAFQVGTYSPNIVCVRDEFRRQGLGTALFEASLLRARRDNVNILWGECMPTNSFPFWRQRGFERWNDPTSPEILIRRILARRYDFPKGAPSVAVEVAFVSEDDLYARKVPGEAYLRPRAAMLEDGSVMLAERLIGIRPLYRGDIAVKIAVNGKELCFCKAKHDPAVKAGVRFDGPGRNVFLDVVECASSS